MTSTPTTCRAWLQEARGKPADVLKLKEDALVPKPGPGEVLVEVHSVALNPVGYKIMGLAPWPVIKLPAIPELDVSGSVVDANGTAWNAGDHVFGQVTMKAKFSKGHGAMAEYIVVSAENLVAKPAAFPFDQAAGIVTVGMTAYQCLAVPGHQVKEGSSVFVNGGSSSVGQMAIQLARNMGATDIGASCSKENESLVKDLGATEVYDYRASPLTDQLKTHRFARHYDLIVDAVGSPELFTASPNYLKPDGLFTTIAASGSTIIPTAFAMLQPKLLGGTPRAYKAIGMEWKPDQLNKMLQWHAQDMLTVPIDGSYKSDHSGVMKAYDRLMSGRAKGKVIVEMQ